MTNELTASRNGVGEDTQALARDLRRVMRDAEALLQDVGSVTAEGLAVARGKVEAKVGEVRGRFAETRDLVVENARHAADSTNAYLKDNTWTVVGVAVVVGVVAGLLTMRR